MPRYFLDTSAFAKLYHTESGTDYLDRLLLPASAIGLVSRLALVEIESVIASKVRTGVLDLAGQAVFRRRLRSDIIQQRIRIGAPIEDRHYQRSRRLLVQYGTEYALRTLDALQLALFLDLQNADPEVTLVTSDLRMRQVAHRLSCPSIDPANPSLLR